MAEYFGFQVDEREDGVDFPHLLTEVDPRHHRAIAWGLHQLCQWYGDKAYRKIDEWFTIIYGTILMVEGNDSLESKNKNALESIIQYLAAADEFGDDINTDEIRKRIERETINDSHWCSKAQELKEELDAYRRLDWESNGL